MNRLALSSENNGIQTLVQRMTQLLPQAINTRARDQRWRCRTRSQRPMAASSTPVSSRISGIQMAETTTSQRRRSTSPNIRLNTARGSWHRSV